MTEANRPRKLNDRRQLRDYLEGLDLERHSGQFKVEEAKEMRDSVARILDRYADGSMGPIHKRTYREVVAEVKTAFERGDFGLSGFRSSLFSLYQRLHFDSSV